MCGGFKEVNEEKEVGVASIRGIGHVVTNRA